MNADLEIQQMVDRVILAQTHDEPELIQAAIQSLRLRFDIGTEDRRRAIEALAKRLVEYIIPPCYAHLMLTAKEGSGFFDMSYLTASSEGEYNLESQEIADWAKKNETEFLEIFNSRASLQSMAAELAEKVKQFIAAKQVLCSEMGKIGAYLNDHLLNKVSPQAVAAFLRWTDTVRSFRAKFRQGRSPRGCTPPFLAWLPRTWAAFLHNLLSPARTLPTVRLVVRRPGLGGNLSDFARQDSLPISDTRPLKRPKFYDPGSLSYI